MESAEPWSDVRVVCVVSWRNGAVQREFLILHPRYAGGVDFEGEWAWTPPAGVIEEGEEAYEAARRELREETGLNLACTPLEGFAGPVNVFSTEVPPHLDVVLDDEHDRYLWVSAQVACRACLPSPVATQVAAVAASLNAPRRCETLRVA